MGGGKITPFHPTKIHKLTLTHVIRLGCSWQSFSPSASPTRPPQDPNRPRTQIFPGFTTRNGQKSPLSVPTPTRVTSAARECRSGYLRDKKGFSTGLNLRQRSTIAIGHQSAAKLLIQHNRKGPCTHHVEADKSAPDTRPAR